MNTPRTSYSYETTTRTCIVTDATEFPREILQHGDMEILQMTRGSLTDLPQSIQELPNLRIAFFRDHKFIKLPQALLGCKNLEMVGFRGCELEELNTAALPSSVRAIVATDNKITSIDASIRNMGNLQKLMLTGNLLKQLPKELLECKNLELLRIANNRLTEFPLWLLDLPNLAWLADSGNPYSYSPPGAQTQPVIAFENIIIGPQLGYSANNTVHSATYQDEELAVKLFGAKLSTDGTTTSELAANLQVGDHAHIPGALHAVEKDGEIIGITMRKLNSSLQNLAKPPDFITLTRDVYPGAFTPSIVYAAHCLLGVSAALTHMHAQGIAHGDVYAHNILVDASGCSQLIDLGAAALYKPGSSEATARQRLDRRAFAILVNELLSQTVSSNTDLQSLLLDTVSPAANTSFASVQTALKHMLQLK